MLSFKKRPAPEPCFQIGQYQIDMRIEGMEGLSPLSREELEALGSTVQFRGEEILHAPAARFMGVEWDTILGTVNERLYKIAVQWVGPRADVGRINRQIVIECTKRYGNGKNMAFWDTSDGNLVLQSANMGGHAMLSLFATSGKTRDFVRVR